MAGDGASDDDARAGDATTAEGEARSPGANDATLDGASDTLPEDASARSADESDVPADRALDDAGPSDARAEEGAASDSAVIDGAPAGDAAARGPDAEAISDASDASDVSAEVPDAAPVVPVLTNGDYVFASGNLSFAVDPQHGARVVSFSLAGVNVLTGTDANATNYGSTFWTSPQSDWTWPPPPEIDSNPYAASVDGGTLILRGSENPALGVRVTKVFSLDPVRGVVSITYGIDNVGASARSLAPWEVSRVHLSGEVFFPTGIGAHSADSGPPLLTQQASGATWFDADAATVTANIKYFADGSRGWLAQESGGLLFVKKFSDVPPVSQAPGESEIELFVSGDRAYVELENQGAYAPLAPAASLQWTVRWYLVQTPPGVDAAVGSAELVAFVDGLK